MQPVSISILIVILSHSFLNTSCQRIQGRYIRPSQPKCESPSGCSIRDDYNDKDYKSSYDKPAIEDDYRSITGDEDSNLKHDNKPGKVKFDSDDYDHKAVRDELSYKPDGSYIRNPDASKTDYIPKPREDSKEDSYRPSSSGSGYNRQPIRGGYNPRPSIGANRDAYNPKPVEESGYNPKPIETTGYNPKPEDKYNPKPVSDTYRPKPDINRDNRPISGGGGYRPVPRPRPVPGGNYKPETLDRPSEPYYPNKDLGGYEDPKDDDYTDIGTGIKDEHDENKPIPLVDEKNCICVPYYQCQEGHIVTDGAGIIDARKKRPEPDEELPLDGKFNPPVCGPIHVCCNTPQTSTVKPYEHKCGMRNPSGINSRILSPSNKGEADFGEWPWQAAILKAEGKVNIFQCGGVLIDKFHVITVAHCVFHLYKYNQYPLKVRLGEWDTQTTTEFLAHEDYRVSKIIVHPEFKNTSLWNDIAILRLEEAVLFAPHIDTVCLPKYDEEFSQQNCVVTGWGKDAYQGGTFSNIMKEVALQVIDNYQCEEMLRKTRLGRFYQLHEGFLCAGGEYGLDSCKGDGGGPLVCYRKDKSYALAGIVSWGIDCGQPGVPGVYVKIQKYVDWISKNTGVDLEDYWPKY